MRKTLKPIAYVVLIICALSFGYGFYHHYSRATSSPSVRSTNEPPVASTNAAPAQSGSNAAMMSYGAALLIAIVALGLLVASDFTHFFASRMEDFIFSEDLGGVKDPEYEEAEKVWANGNHLEAIQLMREYLQERPREQYVALRIAEIYEKDLGNFVAAVLEYEEILKKKLPPERWGWTAIHLANLYSGKLNKTEQAELLLRRIISEHPQTAAAKKARERLGEPEPESSPPPTDQTKGSNQSGTPPFTLPPGFRPK